MFLLTCVFYKGNNFLMKLDSVKNVKYNTPNTSFTGATTSLINFWQFVDAGGRALQFTVEDMTGTNIPRSIKGLNAGKKYTGHYNFPAFFQEAIREFLTGPTMCIVPWVIISLAKKSGETANTHVENIKNLSHLMEKTTVEQGKNLEDMFYNTVVRDLLEQTIGKNGNLEKLDEPIEKIAGQLKNLSQCKDKKVRASLLSNLQTSFEEIIKSRKSDFKEGGTFINAKYTKDAASTVGQTGFKDYANYITAFMNDFKKFGMDKSKLSEFKNTWIGKRILTVAGMIFITGILMAQIPKLYTLASGRINPNATAIYDEAEKIKNGNTKEQKDEKANNKTEAKNNNANKGKTKGKIFAAIGAIAALAFAGAYFFTGKPKFDAAQNILNKLDDAKKYLAIQYDKLAKNIGEKIGDKSITDKILSVFEPTGANNSFFALVGLMVGTVMIPRVITAAKRNPDNKEATKDEIKEILFRDVQSVLIVLLALKSLNAVIAGIATKYSGIPMTTKPYEHLISEKGLEFRNRVDYIFKNPKDILTKIFNNIKDTLHPTGGVRALSNEEFTAKYSNYKFGDLKKLFDQVESEKGDKNKVCKKIIDGTIKQYEELLYGKKGLPGLIERIKMTINKNGEPITTTKEEIIRLEQTLEALRELQKKQDIADSLVNNSDKNIQSAIEVFFENPNNSLVTAGKGINAWLRTAALTGEASYLGFGIPALNQLRLEKKYLRDHKNDVLEANEDTNSSNILMGKNIKAHQVKLYHDFIK